MNSMDDWNNEFSPYILDRVPPTSVQVIGGEAKAGDSVIVHPKVRADAMDMMLDGKTARVETIHQDFEERLYVVVTLDDDPGREQIDERVMPGHRFFFFPEEVELLKDLDIPWRQS